MYPSIYSEFFSRFEGKLEKKIVRAVRHRRECMALPAGVPALIVLCCGICAGAFTGFFTALGLSPAQRVSSIAVTTLAAPSAVLWGWALVKCAGGSFDLGAVSFALALCGAFVSHPRSSACSASWRATLWCLGCVTVAVNYALGLAIVGSSGDDFKPFLLLYFAAGVAFYAFAGTCGSALVYRGRPVGSEAGILRFDDAL